MGKGGGGEGRARGQGEKGGASKILKFQSFLLKFESRATTSWSFFLTYSDNYIVLP